jgi:hypothetical protein
MMIIKKKVVVKVVGPVNESRNGFFRDIQEVHLKLTIEHSPGAI